MENGQSDEDLFSDNNGTQDQSHTSRGFKPSALHYRNIRSLTNSKLIHLVKRLFLENTTWAHNEALKIVIILLRSIPPMGYIAEDLLLALIRLLQRDFRLKGVNNDGVTNHEKLVLKTLSIAGSTTAFLRPLIMMHGVRLLAANGHIYEMKYQIQRNCTEWNLEKHHVAQYYKWILNHTDAICNADVNQSMEFKLELEHILKTCAEQKILPNASIFRLFTETHKDNPQKIEEVLETFINLYPGVYFLRRYRAELCLTKKVDCPCCCLNSVKSYNVKAYVYASGLDQPSIAFAMERKKSLTLKELILLLFDTTITEPNNKTNWERLIYHLLTEAPLDDTLEVIDNLFRNELSRARSLFTNEGTWALYIRGNLVRYYLATANIVLFKKPEVYGSLYRTVKSLTGVTLERRHMEAKSPVWVHFKKLHKCS
ncbi:dockerin type I repeat-containing protein protein, putative [Babesia ovis]|uniref:Dockerin type I repeat-containing protein protein, putative n=1 Tax=Babesia ovis TaxID=5869 RepID=A0A9W5WUK7_BABOV|nr:dockerin type I repeat-containing protein protein, putative [Babesia ovis]